MKRLPNIAYRRAAISEWDRIAAKAVRKGCDARDAALPEDIDLLGTSLKTLKTDKDGGTNSRVLYLAPATASGRNVCPWSTPECRSTCLGEHSGQMSMTPARNARDWKTQLYFGDRELFWTILANEIASHEKACEKTELLPVIRLDGTSDLGLAGEIAATFPGVIFYDYSKDPKRALASAKGDLPDNWHVTMSYSGSNRADCVKVLQAGGNVATVFGARPGIEGRRPADPLPATWEGFPVVDGDKSDARWLDGRGTVAGLRFKASTDWAGSLARAGSFVEVVA